MVKSLILKAFNARTETPSQEGKGSKVDLSVAQSVGVMFLQRQIIFVVEQAIGDEGSVPIRVFNEHAVERRVIISDKGVEFHGIVAELRAIIGLLQDLARKSEALTIAGGGGALPPMLTSIQMGDRINDFGQGCPLRLLSRLPIAAPPELLIADVWTSWAISAASTAQKSSAGRYRPR